MSRYLIVLALLSLFPMGASAQRHGRADSVQNYTKSLRRENPQLSLYLEPAHKWVYFHMTDVQKMRRTTVSTLDPTTKAINSYEGVRLDELVPDKRVGHTFEVFKGSFWGFRDRRVVSSTDLNLESETLVADTVNGKRLAGNSPFYFVGKNQSGDSIVIKKLAHIKFGKSQ